MEHLEKVLALFHAEIEKIAARGLTARELEDTREQLKGNMLIALESTTNRMNRLSTGFLYGVEPKLPEVTLKPYLETTSEDIKAVARELLDLNRMSITMIAPTSEAAEILSGSPFGGRPVVTYPAPRSQNKA